MDTDGKKSQIHRLLAIILGIPIIWQAVTGYILYFRYDSSNNARPWKDMLVKLHNGEFLGNLIFIIGAVYAILLICFVINGYFLFFVKKTDQPKK